MAMRILATTVQEGWNGREKASGWLFFLSFRDRRRELCAVAERASSVVLRKWFGKSDGRRGFRGLKVAGSPVFAVVDLRARHAGPKLERIRVQGRRRSWIVCPISTEEGGAEEEQKKCPWEGDLTVASRSLRTDTRFM